MKKNKEKFRLQKSNINNVNDQTEQDMQLKNISTYNIRNNSNSNTNTKVRTINTLENSYNNLVNITKDNSVLKDKNLKHKNKNTNIDTNNKYGMNTNDFLINYTLDSESENIEKTRNKNFLNNQDRSLVMNISEDFDMIKSRKQEYFNNDSVCFLNSEEKFLDSHN